MIVVDPLFDTTPFTTTRTPKCFRNTLASHMMTTLEGQEGTKELITFARKLGLKPEWIQYPGERRQHFDLVESKRRKAVEQGAVEVSSDWWYGDPI